MSLTKQDIVDYILLNSGQFIAGLDSTLISEEQLDIIIKKELSYYSKHKPLVKTEAFKLYDNKSFSTENVVPESIVKITARKISNVFIPRLSANWGNISNAYWQYNKPVLRFSLPEDVYEVQYFMYHEYVNDSIEGMDLSDERFLDLVLAKFMVVLGRSRRSFRLEGLPIEVDFNDLVSEGQELYQSTRESIRESNDFWLAIL